MKFTVKKMRRRNGKSVFARITVLPLFYSRIIGFITGIWIVYENRILEILILERRWKASRSFLEFHHTHTGVFEITLLCICILPSQFPIINRIKLLNSSWKWSEKTFLKERTGQNISRCTLKTHRLFQAFCVLLLRSCQMQLLRSCRSCTELKHMLCQARAVCQ